MQAGKWGSRNDEWIILIHQVCAMQFIGNDQLTDASARILWLLWPSPGTHEAPQGPITKSPCIALHSESLNQTSVNLPLGWITEGFLSWIGIQKMRPPRCDTGAFQSNTLDKDQHEYESSIENEYDSNMFSYLRYRYYPIEWSLWD